MLKKTSLFEIHKRLGAKIIEFGPWLMPLYYTSIVDEHNTVRNRVGLFDVSHMGEFFIRGKDALAFIQRLITNDTSRLSNNQALYTPMCNDRGTIIDDLLVYKFSDEYFMLVVNASNIEKDYRWIEGVAKKFNKEDFIGKEALLKRREAGIKEKLVGFELLERGIPRCHYSVIKKNKEVGVSRKLKNE